MHLNLYVGLNNLRPFRQLQERMLTSRLLAILMVLDKNGQRVKEIRIAWIQIKINAVGLPRLTMRADRSVGQRKTTNKMANNT